MNVATKLMLPRGDLLLALERSVEGGPISPDHGISGVWRVGAGVHGPTVVVSAGIHGDEPSGLWAMSKVMGEITKGTLALRNGSITFVAGNELAIREHRRQIRHNLNRLFGRSEIRAPGQYEYERARQLEPVLLESDYIMDFHSTSKPSPSFALLYDRRFQDGVKLGFPHIMYGDHDLFQNLVQGTTIGFTESHGVPGIVLEAGQHQARSSFRSAYKYLRMFLAMHGIIDYEPAIEDYSVISQGYRFYYREVLKAKDFRYVRDFETLFWLPPNSLIGHYRHQELGVQRYSVIVMPTDPKIMELGDVLYYLAEPTLWC